MPDTFPNRLKSLRKIKGYTQEQVSSMLGIKRGRYNAWEQSISEPSIELLVRLSQILHVSLDELTVSNENNEVYLSLDSISSKIISEISTLGEKEKEFILQIVLQYKKI